MQTTPVAQSLMSESLSAYVKRRNGVPLGGSGSLKNMLCRSLGAHSIQDFWRYWNPIWGYYLAKLFYIPSRKFLAPALAAMFTFIMSGALHDLAVSAIYKEWVVICTPWFFFMGLGLVISKALNMNLSGLPWVGRAAVHIIYIFICLALAFGVKNAWLNYA